MAHRRPGRLDESGLLQASRCEPRRDPGDRPRRRDAGRVVHPHRGSMMGAQTDTLLRYRPWRGQFRGPLSGSVAMARASVRLLVRRRLFWGLFALAALVFLFYSFAQYLAVWIPQMASSDTVRVGVIPVKVGDLTKLLERLNLNGTAHTFGNFFWFQG